MTWFRSTQTHTEHRIPAQTLRMKTSVTLVLLAIAATVGVCRASPLSRVFACPDLTTLAPCVCYTDNQLGIFIECINLNSMDELKSAFQDTTFPFTRITRLEIADCNLEGKNLEAIFGSLTFQEVLMIDNSIGSVDADVFKASSHDLATFQYTDNATADFPLNPGSADFENLKDLYVEAACDTIPSIGAPKLLNLVLTCSALATDTFDVGSITSQELESLHLDRMPGLKQITGDFAAIPLLRSVVFERNGLETGPFSFSGDIVTLDLSYNLFEDLPEITGISKNTKISMRNNKKLRNLPESTTSPLLSVLAEGTGTLDLTGVAVYCNCELVWLLRNEALMSQVKGLDTCMADDGSTSPLEDIIDFLDTLCPK